MQADMIQKTIIHVIDLLKRAPRSECLFPFVVTALLCGIIMIYLCYEVVVAVGGLPRGTAIRPMGLTADMFGLSCISVVIGVCGATACVGHGAQDRAAACLFGILCIGAGIMPYIVSIRLFHMLILLQDLKLAD
jgi:hypothetical protein